MARDTNISKKIWKILDRSPQITKNLNHNLINIRALAKYIIKEEKIDATLDSVISSIRRYEYDSSDNIFEKAYQLIHKTNAILTRSPLIEIAVVKDTEVQKKLSQLFSIIRYNAGEVLRIIQGDGAIKIIIDKKNLEKVKTLFLEQDIIDIEQDIGEISVHMHPEGGRTPGVLAILGNELALNGINVKEIMSCLPELMWFVDEKDIPKAYNVLYQLWKEK